EIPSPVTGTVKSIVVPEGTVANVGDVLVEIDAPGHEGNEDSGSEGVAATEQTPEAPAAEPTTESSSASAEASDGGVFQFKLPDIGEGI
ncbi:biotin/lipoyl-containing protein, partial [Enterococcus mundtii]